MNITKSTRTTVKISLTADDLKDKLGLPSNSEVFIHVPGGGDWSNTRLDIDSDNPVLVTYVLLSDALRSVVAERRRQIEVEGWTPEHDDQHDKGQLAEAACCYTLITVEPDEEADSYAESRPPFGWPWAKAWWKPTTPRRDLVKAGALILAEIERLDRAALKGGAE